jgi:hypothetical protein
MYPSDSESELETTESAASATPKSNMMLLSAAAVHPDQPAPRSMEIAVEVQGQKLRFLIDSGSSACFLDIQCAAQFVSQQKLRSSVQVAVAGGDTLSCVDYFPKLVWSSQGHEFTDEFRVLSLQTYDGIVGLDWLAKHSPMVTHWAQQWLAFPMGNELIVLHGDTVLENSQAVIELHLIQPLLMAVQQEQCPQLTALLDEFASVFEEPSGLPPVRQYDHRIPLIPGARPVSMRPYRVTPELKTEIEKQVQVMLKQGVITHSSSLFASPVLLVKKVHYNELKEAIQAYPLPIIDELLDELLGARWFSKLDLRAGYHQIRLAPGEEAKTSFQTHNGHYEFKVMAFGLTGAPATFQFAMNPSLAPVLRKCALVFFDDILVYSSSYEEHMEHLRMVLEI